MADCPVDGHFAPCNGPNRHPFWHLLGDKKVQRPGQRWHVSLVRGLQHADLLQHLALPVITLSVISVAEFSRFQRSAMLDVLASDYLRTARAKGLSQRVVYLKHALRNALLPTVTLVALSIGLIFGGAVVTETVFAWPGLGFL